VTVDYIITAATTTANNQVINEKKAFLVQYEKSSIVAKIVNDTVDKVAEIKKPR
jgi:hypothetical protein